MQESLYQTADAGDSLSDSGCRRQSISQRMQESLYQTALAGGTLSRLRAKKGPAPPPPPLGNFADISYLEEISSRIF